MMINPSECTDDNATVDCFEKPGLKSDIFPPLFILLAPNYQGPLSPLKTIGSHIYKGIPIY